MVTEAKRAQAKWMGRAAMRLASQALAMEVEEVEQAVSVTSSARKVSSDAVGLSNWADRLPEGLGTG